MTRDKVLHSQIEIGRKYELSQNQLRLMKGEEVLGIGKKSHNPPVLGIGAKAHYPQKRNIHFNQPKRDHFDKRDNKKSDSCGSTHNKGNCPVNGTVCYFCHKRDHWRKVCWARLTKVNTVDIKEESHEDDDSDLLHIYANTTDLPNEQPDKWVCNIKVCVKLVPVRIDTGAKCNILTSSEFSNLDDVQLKKSNRILKSYSNHRITPIGTAIATGKQKQRKLGLSLRLWTLHKKT